MQKPLAEGEVLCVVEGMATLIVVRRQGQFCGVE